MEGVVHWLNDLQSGAEVLEEDEVLMTTENTDVSYDADGRRRFRRHRPRAQTSPARLWDLVLRYCRNVRPTWVKFNSKDTKESELCSRFEY